LASATTNHYDLIVLGTDFAGLVAAGLVARRGKRVLVIPHGPIDGRYRLARRGFSLDTAPLVHLGCPAVQRVFEELGLWTQIRREHRPLGELLHYAMPDHRLDAEPNEASWLREADREWPDDPVAQAWEHRRQWGEATDELLDELLGSDSALVPDGFWGRRFLARVSNQLPAADVDELGPLSAGHPLRAQSRALEAWLQHLSPGQLGKAASLRISRLWERGPEDRSGGAPGLREQLVQRLELKSGEVKPNLRIAEILHKRGRVTGISLLGKHDRYGCDHMLIATDPRRLIDGPLVAASLPRPLQVSLDNIETAARRYVLHLDIDERGIGPGLEGLVVCVPEGPGSGTSEGVGMIYLRLDPGPPPRPGLRSLSVVRVLGPDERTDDARERILDELDERGVLPFARPWLRLIHSPHDGREATDGAGQRLEALGADTALRLPMDPIYRLRGAEPSLGVGLLPHSSGIKNLYFASRMTYPGLGLEGEFAAGWAAAGAVAGAGRAGLGRNLFLGRG
jgi:phytoene dehydrogenase-like protein